MRKWLAKVLAYLPHAMIAIIVVLIALLGYQRYAMNSAFERARQAGDIAVLGNTDANETVVAYIDYNCPPCAATGKAMAQVLKNRDDIKLVVRPLPMLGNRSETLARFAIAAALQDQFKTYHRTFLAEMRRQAQGKDEQLALDRADALRVARQAGLDIGELRQTVKSKRVDSLLTRNVDTSGQLDVIAVPTYIIGNDTYTPFEQNPTPADFHHMLDAVQQAP